MSEREKRVARTARQTVPTDSETLTQRVYRALDDIEPLRDLDLPVRVEVSDGVVTLHGRVVTYALKARALQAAQSVSGVQQVRDGLLIASNLDLE
jgi:osmotically-inducible protein OsmY